MHNAGHVDPPPLWMYSAQNEELCFMGGITGILIIIIIYLLVSGKSNLPDVGTGLGRSIRNFKRSLKERDEIDVTPREERSKREQHETSDKDQNS